MPIRSQNQLPQSPNVHYYQAPAFFNSGDIPRAQMPLVLLLAVIAGLIGLVIAMGLIDNVVYADKKQAAAVQTAISSVDVQPVPVLGELRNLSSEDMLNTLAGKGYLLREEEVDVPEGSKVDTLDVTKLPDTCTEEEIASAEENGVTSLPSERAVVYLADSWNVTLSRTDTSDLKVKYCMFGPATIEQAIVQAVETQGWGGSSLGESGVDQMGNTYQHGSIEIEGKQYRWSVFGCPLKDVYRISGLPASSWYVSARLMG